ncbi:MAG TPA: hypothetical protein VMB78_06315 [Dissulfurispiraceae bacterium]|nr:hypothetical protein [Dissulfurispiraceae bacterium]
MKRLIALGIILLVFVSACGGKKTVKKVTPDSAMTTEAFAVVEKLRDAYIKNDRTAIEKNTTRAGYLSMTNSRKSFDSAELTFTPMLVEIFGDTVHVYISWNGTWKKGGKITEDRGLADFILKEKPLKLDQILREDPFSRPE